MVSTDTWEWHSLYNPVERLLLNGQTFCSVVSVVAALGCTREVLIGILMELRYMNTVPYPDAQEKKKYGSVLVEIVLDVNSVEFITYPDLWSAVQVLGTTSRYNF